MPSRKWTLQLTMALHLIAVAVIALLVSRSRVSPAGNHEWLIYALIGVALSIGLLVHATTDVGNRKLRVLGQLDVIGGVAIILAAVALRPTLLAAIAFLGALLAATGLTLLVVGRRGSANGP